MICCQNEIKPNKKEVQYLVDACLYRIVTTCVNQSQRTVLTGVMDCQSPHKGNANLLFMIYCIKLLTLRDRGYHFLSWNQL